MARGSGILKGAATLLEAVAERVVRARARLERVSAVGLAVLNVPTRADLRALGDRLDALEASLDELEHRLEGSDR